MSKTWQENRDIHERLNGPINPTIRHELMQQEINELRANAERFKQALEKISAVRNDIISTQSINWSRHIYPLVAALDEVGVGCEIDAEKAAS